MNFLKLMLALLIFLVALGELSATEISKLKWHMDPHGQDLLIEQDDLHSEYITVSPKINMGINKTHNFKTNKKVKVAIIDSGIDYNHPELKDLLAYKKSECLENNVFPNMENDHDQNGLKGDCLGWNFNDDNNDIDDIDGHGTHVAGLIADFFHAHKESLEILPLRIFSGEKDIPLPIKMGKALEYAIKENVDLIHMSMGWPSSLMSVKLQKLIEKALDQGIMIVAAAGNSSQRANIYPCKIEGVLCVGALRANGEKAPFSNYGPQVDFMLPGERVLSTIPTALDPISLPIKGYDYKSGTSQAAPLLSGAILFLKAINNDYTPFEIKEKLFQASSPNRYAQRGVINLEQVISKEIIANIQAKLKSLNTFSDTGFELEIVNPFQKTLTKKVTLTCEEDSVLNVEVTLKAGETKKIPVEIANQTLEFDCELNIGNEKTNFILRYLAALNTNLETLPLDDKKIIMPTRTGVRSRLISVPNKDGLKRAPYFYLSGEKNFVLYHLNQKIGEIETGENCKRLRLLQLDLNQDSDMDLLYEELCDGKFLRYSFLDNQLNEIFPKVIFTPKLSIINYNDFKYVLKNNLPHFRFINSGFVPRSNDPWNPSPTGRDIHAYELAPSMIDGKLEFTERVLDNKKLWAKALGLRTTPRFSILNIKDNKLLFKHATKTYWYHLDTEKVTLSDLNHLLISGDEIADVIGSTNEYSVNTLITPYEFRSFVNTGIILRYQQDNYYDPLMNVVAVTKDETGYHAFVKSYISMHKLSFDMLGNFTHKEVFTIERFDFLNGDELDALVIPMQINNSIQFIVDGSKIHTNYIDIINSQRTSFKVPTNCSSQMPVEVNGEVRLIFSCFEDGQGVLKSFALPE